MADRSKLMWSTVYWLCLAGCTKLSAGCTNCWALHEAQKRSKRSPIYRDLIVSSSAGPQWTGLVKLLEERLFDPLKWATPQVAWLTSMSDLFHEKLSTNDIARIFAVMVQDPRHIYQVLTKRIERARELLVDNEFRELVEHHAKMTAPRWPLDYCWVGTKFISFQPLLEEVRPGRMVKKVDPVWAIIGGEAGLRCRPYKMDWGLKLHNQLLNQGVKSNIVCYPYGL
jgi:protein gp37